MKPQHHIARCLALGTVLAASLTAAAAPPDSATTAAAIDASLFGSNATAPSPCDDATFLRRAMFDLVGRPATPGEITAFGLDPSENRRTETISALLSSAEYGQNWSHYWRDAIFRRATNMRAGLVRGEFEVWMASQLNANAKWDDIVSEMITFTGPVNANGASALIFAQEAVPEEVAAEVSRLFVGIQIQCANCHDHPWDSWKREQFHEFTAFFPRMSLRRDRASDNMFDYELSSMNADRSRNPIASEFMLTRIDRDRNKVISEQEAKGTQLARIFNGPIRDNIDKNGDGKLTIEELTTARPAEDRPGQGTIEHFMPDLADPGSEGKQIDPAFFLSRRDVKDGLTDDERRASAADFVTSKSNPWFAKAIINRIWFEMTGTAFYTPIDDIGPDRECTHPETLELLTQAFIRSDYDLKWLIETIARTRMYQRAPNATGEDFARCEPIRLRSDQLYSALCQTLNVTGLPLRPTDRRQSYGMNQGDAGRTEFDRIFGFDPSTPRDELTGSIPESLFLMNSSILSNVIQSPGNSNPVTQIATNVLADDDVVRELYLTAVGREPSAEELKIAMDHATTSANIRSGFEDICWALINSPEFSSRK